ncbi:MAG: hypothetical protein HYU36_22000 [Planctomycetes bacterium]|nr:hypothetical protein [Planctomycetota bacterium]
MENIRRQIEICREKLRNGILKDEDLEAVMASLDGADAGKARRQSLLYVYATGNSVVSAPLSMSIIEEGSDRQALNARGEFLYRSVHEAMQDGWRVIKFPEMTLAMDEQNTYGLGFEFVLERFRG